MVEILMKLRGLIGAGSGALLGAYAGFALLFYGYLLLHPPGPSRVELETASPLACLVGLPLGLISGGIAGYRLASRCGR